MTMLDPTRSQRSLRLAALGALALLQAAAPAAPGQNPVPASARRVPEGSTRPPSRSLPTPAPQQQPGRTLIDGVRAVVGDRVILESTIRREMDRQFGDQDLTPEQRENEEFAIVREIAKEEIWVQIGKVIGSQDPQQFEETIDGLVQNYLDEQVQEYGSFARMDEELRATRTSWQTLAQEQRARILRDSARQHAIRERFKDGISLLVTPRELRSFYDENSELFAARDSADVAAILFRPGQDVEQRAAAAAAAWRDDPLADATGLAERFGGYAMTPFVNVRQAADDPTRQLVKDFARENPAGAVSEPIAAGANFFVLRLMNKESRDALSFDDIDTQNRIRKMLVDQKLRLLEGRILQWKFEKIMTWPPSLMGGR